MDLIIGAGITGLSYALFSPNKEYLIVEKETEIGGYCRTIKRNGFVWDYSGHFFHFNDDKIKEIAMSSIKNDDVVEVNKCTAIKYGDRFIDFPFQKNIHQLPKQEFIDCLVDLFNTENESDYSNFKEMLYTKFGKSTAEKFLIPYNEKLYACELNKLDKEAMGRFFPYANRIEIVRNFRTANNTSYNGSFLYPKEGAIKYVESIANKIDSNKIMTSTTVESIDATNHVATLSSGETIKYNRLVSTIPFPKLIELCGIEFCKQTYSWNKVLVFNIGFNCKGPDTVHHWIYYPEKKYCFYRVGFYDNILNQDRTSIYVELGFSKNETINADDWKEQVIKDLIEANVITSNMEIVDYQSIVMDPAYVHITSSSNNNVAIIKKRLQIADIYSIGRYGSWTYCSIEDNIKEAYALACTLSC